LVPIDWHLPADWNIRQGGLNIPSLPCSTEMEALIAERIHGLPPHMAADLDWAVKHALAA
jgi:hypothetical protein